MRRPSGGFLGTMLGLVTIGAFVPGNYTGSKEAVLFWICLGAGSGALIGTIIDMIRRPRS